MSKAIVKVATKPEYTAEGSYAELVSVYGYEYALHFTNHEIKVFSTKSLAYDRNPQWKRDGAAKEARKHAEEMIASFGPEFMKRHVELYGEKA